MLVHISLRVYARSPRRIDLEDTRDLCGLCVYISLSCSCTAHCGTQRLRGDHIVSLIRAISRHNIENSSVPPCWHSAFLTRGRDATRFQVFAKGANRHFPRLTYSPRLCFLSLHLCPFLFFSPSDLRDVYSRHIHVYTTHMHIFASMCPHMYKDVSHKRSYSSRGDSVSYTTLKRYQRKIEEE